MSGHELVNQPSVADIIGLYAKLLTLDAQNVSSSLEDPATITNKVMRELMEALEDARRNGTSEDKNALFKYFIEIYLKFTAGTPDELVMVKEKPIALPGTQATLFGEQIGNTGMWSGVTAPTTPRSSVRSLRFNLEQLIDRIFFTMNFYSKEYVPLFFEKAIETLQMYSFSQKTMHIFLADDSPKLLLYPITARIATFINKTGQSFIMGLTSFHFNSPKFSLAQSPVSLKSMLKEYFLSKFGAKLFPEWFQFLNPITRETVVNNLIAQIP